MFGKETDALLQSNLEAKSLAPPLMVCNRTLHHDIDDLVMLALPGMKLSVVADVNTEAAFGAQVYRALKGRFDCSMILLEGMPVADDNTVGHIRQKSAMSDALVAVGSGSINDLCKYAAFTDGKPYVVFPTAASMNGYLSANASITVDGYKKTCAARMPKAVFCDMSVIAAAPPRLSKSGLGDSLARPTAQADWLLSHLLLDTLYDEAPFALLSPLEAQMFDSARGIARGDTGSIGLLMQTLLLSGLGMTIAGGSYPASQGEHMVAHAHEMLAKHGTPTLHGEEIGVTTLYMARMQEAMLRKIPVFRPLSFPADAIATLFGPRVAQEAKKAYKEKQERIEEIHLNGGRWEAIAARIAAVMIPPERIAAILGSAEAPVHIEALGWAQAEYGAALSHARFLRDRFTFLDLE